MTLDNSFTDWRPILRTVATSGQSAATIRCLYVYPSVRPSVRHKPVLYRNRNDWTNRAGFWHGRFLNPSTYPTLSYKDIQVPPKISVLSSGNLTQTLDLKHFAKASRSCRQPDLLTTFFCSQRVVAGHCYTSVIRKCSNSFICCSSWKISTDIKRRAVCLR